MRLVGEVWRQTPMRTGCFDFLLPDIDSTVDEALSRCPEGAALIGNEAKQAMKNNYFERLRALYEQPLLFSIHELVKKYDVVEYMSTSGKNVEALDQAGREMRANVMADGGKALRQRFFMAEDYEKPIRENFIHSQEEFLNRLMEKKEEISSRFFAGRPIARVIGLSSGGADMHRHGRTVMGVKTDAGTCFYKPHDCGLDAFYHELVSAWFSDCTIAADVIEGDGYAFVTELTHSEVDEEKDIAVFYRNFGRLTALFHALGSTDMHQENIMSCGVRPSCLDIETLLYAKPAGSAASSEKKVLPFPPSLDYSNSVARSGVLPFRIHRGGLLSPLYADSESVKCMPRFQGRTYSIEGYETVFLEGFRDGYFRMLRHREEIKRMLENHRNATIRQILRNTMYYYFMRSKLFRPDALSDAKQRDEVLRQLRIPYEFYGAEVKELVVNYEAQCILGGDIPYFCAALDGHALCGEDVGQVVQENYLEKSAKEYMYEHIGRLSEAEEVFEEDYIRNSLRHAPLDQPEYDAPAPLPDQPLARCGAEALLREMLDQLAAETIRHTDGTRSWICGTAAVESQSNSGVLTVWADAALLCGTVLLVPSLAALHPQARELARISLDGFQAFIRHRDSQGLEEPEIIGGLGVGLGEVLLSLHMLKKASLEGAEEALRYFLRSADILSARKPEINENIRKSCTPWNVKEGRAGLVLALALLNEDPSGETVRRCGEEILNGLPAAAYDGWNGAAGMGAALAYAYRRTGDSRFSEGAAKAFEQVRQAYAPHLKGWPELNAPMPWAATKAPASAGIALMSLLAGRWMDCGEARETLSLALACVESEDHLLRLDSMNDGNALTALCCMIAGKPDRAGRILAAMARRKDEKGVFTVSQPFVRSYFDVSVLLGTLGVGIALAAYCK